MLPEELIEKLKDMPKDKNVVLYNSYDGMHESVKDVKYSERTEEIILKSFED
jgi:hypothetical protein